jgi:hypothetical protein
MGLRPTFNGVRRANPDKQAARSAVKTKLSLDNRLAQISCTKLFRRLARCRCRRRRRRRRSRCRRRRRRRSSGRCRGTRCGCGRRSRGAQQRPLQHTAGLARRAGAHVRQQQAGREKQPGEYSSQLGKQGAGAARAEHGAGRARAEARARFRAFATLQQDEADNHQCKQHVHRQNETTQHRNLSVTSAAQYSFP